MSLKTRKTEQGFTLIEMLVSLAIGLVILGITMSLFFVQKDTFSRQDQLSEMQQNVRAAMDMIIRDMRMAGYDPAEAGFVGIGIDTADSSTVTVYADLDGDGTTNGTDETIEYYFNNDQIARNTDASPIAEYIESLAFTYFDSAGNATTTASGIRKIQVDILGRTRGTISTSGYGYGSLTSSVRPKNLGI